MAKKQYWLMKSEPEKYSIDDLARDGSTCWEGVRNYQARNFMRDDMRIGDRVLFYHSNAKPTGIAGIAEIVSESYDDHYAQDPNNRYFDAKATPEKPIWAMVDVGYVETFSHFVSLPELRDTPELDDMLVLKKGMRLSIQPTSKEHFDIVCRMGRVARKRVAS